MRSGIHRLLRIALGFCVAILLVYSAGLLTLRLMGYEVFVVVSDSMRPTAMRGDLVLAKPTASWQRGDVALFRKSNNLVLHRLVGRDQNGWITRGDANSVADLWRVHPSALTAKAVGVLHAFGYPLLWLQRDAQATLTNTRANNGNSLSSQFWTNPTMAWTIYANASYISTSNPSSVTITGGGARRIYAANNVSPNPRLHLEAKLTTLDGVVPGFLILLNGCVNTSDVISCGWYVTVSHNNKSLMLGLYTSADTRSGVQETCLLPTSFSLTSNQKIVIQIKNDAIYFNVNYNTYCSWPSLSAIANKVGIAKPNGNFAGILVERNNRFAATTAVFW